MNLINNEDLKFLKKLIRLKTTASQLDNLYKAIKLCREYIHSYNIDIFLEQIYVQNEIPSLVLSNNKDLEQDIILLGHLDVAEQDIDFDYKLEGDLLTGPGVAEMKGPVLALIKVFLKLLEENTKLKIALILTTDEEQGGRNGANYLFNILKYRAKLAFSPNNGKNNRSICIAEKGVLHYYCEAKGKLAHGARPWKGENAIENLMAFYQQLKRFYPLPKNDNDWKKSLNLGLIKGGIAINTVPNKAEMYLDIRFTEKDDKEDLKKQIKALADEYNIKLNLFVESDPVFIDPDDIAILKLSKLIEEHYKKPVELMKSNIASDARYLAQNGITVLMMRPDNYHLHKANETIKISAIEDYADIVYKYIKNEEAEKEE